MTAIADNDSGAAHRADLDFADYVAARLPALRRLAMVLCQDWHLADDLVQSAITRLYTRWGRASRADSLDAYVRAIVIREFIHDRRGGWAKRVTLTGSPPDRATSVVDHDGVLDLRSAVANLPPRQRAVLVLRYFCDLNVDQTADILRCSPGTVKSQTSRAIGQLRCTLGRAPGSGADGVRVASPELGTLQGDIHDA